MTDFTSQHTEIKYLQGLTPSKQTPESIERLEMLLTEAREYATIELSTRYDLDKLRKLLPNPKLCYATLNQLGSGGIRLPEEPSILAVQAPALRVQLVNLQANINMYFIAAGAALKRINIVVDRCKAYWTTGSYSEEKWRIQEEFILAAIDLLDLQCDCSVMAADAERTYWMCSQMLEQLDKYGGS